jgi:hypothetical protein
VEALAGEGEGKEAAKAGQRCAYQNQRPDFVGKVHRGHVVRENMENKPSKKRPLNSKKASLSHILNPPENKKAKKEGGKEGGGVVIPYLEIKQPTFAELQQQNAEWRESLGKPKSLLSLYWGDRRGVKEHCNAQAIEADDLMGRLPV